MDERTFLAESPTQAHRVGVSPSDPSTPGGPDWRTNPMRHTAAPIALIAVALIALAACSPAVVAPPSVAPSAPPVASPDPTAEPPSSPAPTVPPSVDPSPDPTDPPKPSDPPKPVVTPTPKPPVVWTSAEKELLRSLRRNAQVDCEPRRHDVPEGVTAAIECRLHDGLVERVGVYQYVDDYAAFGQYRQVLESYGVLLNVGSCWDGVPGDAAWIPGDDLEPLPLHERHGCFFDQHGRANTRVLCGGGLYIGILGRNADLAALERWTDATDENFPGDTPSPPGICYGPRAAS
jgi:hypothetical protein